MRTVAASLRIAPHRAFWKLAPLLPDKLYIRMHFLWNHGSIPRLALPQTFSEKIQWRKLHDRRRILTQFADKYRTRAYVKEKLGGTFLTKLYWASEDPSTLPLEDLPHTFVLKANHGTGWNILVRDKSTIDRDAIVGTLRSWLGQQYPPWRREWGYQNIRPIAFAEEYLTTTDGAVPPDYKFFVFDGRVRLIQVDLDRFIAHTRCLYDRDWNLLPVALAFPKGRGIARPDELDEMIWCAERCSDGIDFVRVDLYNVDGRIVFGELTNYPGGGFERFTPSSFDAVVGEWWRMPAPARLVEDEANSPSAKVRASTDTFF